ncbi:MAG: hypothetical protein GY940_01965, partial [bacterium]|nr:hypothetical protein [bacterium]
SVSPMTVTNSTEKLGPFNGEVSGSPIDGLYKVNRDDGDTFYSFPDLRIYWNTSGQNGLFRITVEYFADDGVTVSGEPNVSPLPSPGCFGVAAAPIGELYVRVNNQPLDVTFDGIFLKDGTNYYEVVVGTKFDFNDEGLCSIMNLTQPSRQYGIEIEYTAHHTGNYMRSYSLKAIPNDKSFTVTFADESYPPSPPSILWEGTPAAGDTQFKNFFSWPKACAYIFYLDAVSRVQNGYNYIQGVHKRKAYYINPN